jgi:hypothetical protein
MIKQSGHICIHWCEILGQARFGTIWPAVKISWAKMGPNILDRMASSLPTHTCEVQNVIPDTWKRLGNPCFVAQSSLKMTDATDAKTKGIENPQSCTGLDHWETVCFAF